MNSQYDFQTPYEKKIQPNKYSNFLKTAINAMGQVNYVKATVGICVLLLSASVYEHGGTIAKSYYAVNEKERLMQIEKQQQQEAKAQAEITSLREANIANIKKLTPQDLQEMINYMNIQKDKNTELSLKGIFLSEYLHKKNSITSSKSSTMKENFLQYDQNFTNVINKEIETINDTYKKIISGYANAVSATHLQLTNEWITKYQANTPKLYHPSHSAIKDAQSHIKDMMAFEYDYAQYKEKRSKLKM